jgi:hypothetical protein
MATENLFEEAWRACLEAHLRYVVEVGDTLNEHSLIDVLKSAGFSDADVMRVRYEVLGEPLLEAEPDSPMVAASAEPEPALEAAPEEISVMAETGLDAEPAHDLPDPVIAPVMVPVMVEPEAALTTTAAEPEPPAEPPPTQLSLF